MGITGLNKVSLIVPVYNAEPWIEECMASIRAQTYPNIEKIVIDDAEGTGAAAARNRGLELATGEYVAFCDADDYLSPDALEKLVGAMDGVDMVCGSFRKFGLWEATIENETAVLTELQIAQYAMRNLRNPRRHQMLSGCWAKLYRRSLLGRFNEELKTAEDVDFNFGYLLCCDDVRFLSDVVYHNRRHPGSLTQTFDPNNKFGMFDFLGCLTNVKKFLLQFYMYDEVEGALDHFKVYHSALYAMRISGLSSLEIKNTFGKMYGEQ